MSKEKITDSKKVLRTTGFGEIFGERNPENKTKLITAFIGERLNREDVFGLIELVEVAAAAKTENRPEADQILLAVTDYLTSIDEPILKILTDSGEKAGQNTNLIKLRQKVLPVQILKEEMIPKKREEVFGGQNSAILSLISDIGSYVQSIESGSGGRRTLVPVNGYGRNDTEKISRMQFLGQSEKTALKEKVRLFDQELSHKQRLLNAVLTFSREIIDRNMTEQLAHLPVYIMEQLQDVAEPNVFWERQYGGVSLKQIFTETDQEKRKNDFLIFLKFVPRGDSFWYTIIDSGLLGPLAAVDEDGISKNNNSATILGLRYSIASDLLINQPADSQTAAEVLTALHELNIPIKRLLNDLEISYYFYLHYFSESEELFTDELIDEFRRERNNLPALLIDELIDWYLKKNIGRIKTYLIQNAPNERVKNEIGQWAAEKIKSNYTEFHTEEILASIRYIMGEQLWKMLFTDEKEQQKTEKVAGDITDSILQRQLWPTEEIYRIENFVKGSLPYMFGIDNIKFIFDPANPDIMAAVIQLRVPRKIAVIASIQKKDGKLDISFSINPKENIEAMQLFKLLVAVELTDNLADIKLAQTEPKETSKKKPPKKDADSPDTTTSGKVAERLNAHAIREDREFKPRSVKCHARHLVGAVNYLNAVENYRQFVLKYGTGQLPVEAQAEREILLADLKNTLEQMNSISDRKEWLIPSLPDEVQEKMERVTDPVDGQTRWVSTWVIGYESPAPDSSVAGDLGGYYERYIRGRNVPQSAAYNPLLVRLSQEPQNP